MADLAGVEAQFSVTLPPDLKAFWLESDGPVLWFEYKELQFMPARDVCSDAYALGKYMPGALPLCLDGNGKICVARVDRRAVIGYFVASCGNLGWEDAVEIAKSFGEFLNDPVSPEKRLDA